MAFASESSQIALEKSGPPGAYLYTSRNRLGRGIVCAGIQRLRVLGVYPRNLYIRSFTRIPSLGLSDIPWGRLASADGTWGPGLTELSAAQDYLYNSGSPVWPTRNWMAATKT